MSTSALIPVTTRRAGNTGFPSLLAAEVIKLKRSSVWVVAVLLPLLAVITGTFNFYRNQGVFTAEWGDLTSQISLFYSMFFCSLGVALLASAAWRMEHRGTSWNAMRTSPHSPVSVVLAKTLVIVLPVLAMQLALIVLAWISGAFVMGLGLAMPRTVIASNLLAVVSIIPLIALQSLLSMLMRSFAAPVALGFVGCVLGFGLGAAQNPRACQHDTVSGIDSRDGRGTGRGEHGSSPALHRRCRRCHVVSAGPCRPPHRRRALADRHRAPFDHPAFTRLRGSG